VTTPGDEPDLLDIAACTHVGRREHNEDRYLIDRELGLVIVADGVGGHQSGDVASAVTCEVMQREIAAGADLRTAVQRANTGVLDAVHSGRGKPGMASTVVAARLVANAYEIAWVGDSRAYLWDGKLRLLSRDHSVVEQELASGLITREEARTHPRRNVILQAVGTHGGDLDIGQNHGQLAPGSCLLLCSDGITDPLDSAQLCDVLLHRSRARETCQRLVDAAYQAGGKDNITALLVAHDDGAQAARAGRAPQMQVWVYDPRTARYEGPDQRFAPAGAGRPADAVQDAVAGRPRAATAGGARPLPRRVIATPQAAPAPRTRVTRVHVWLAVLLGALVLALGWIVA